MITMEAQHKIWRWGAVAIFCGFPLLVIAAIISNVSDAREAAERSARDRATTAAIIVQLKKHQLRTLRPADAASLYLVSGSDSLARAEIQERATALIVQAGGHVAEVQPTGRPEDDVAGDVAIQLTLDIDNEGLLNLLYAIESGVPLLDVVDLNVQGAQAGTYGENDAAGTVHVDITLRGHWRKAAG